MNPFLRSLAIVLGLCWSVAAQAQSPVPTSAGLPGPLDVREALPADSRLEGLMQHPMTPAAVSSESAPVMISGESLHGAHCHDFWTRSTLTGNWCGLRPRLQDSGIRIDGDITQFAFGIGSGINSPGVPALLGQGDAFAYTGRGEYRATIDLEKFGGMPHGKLYIAAQNWWGQFGNVSLNAGSFPPAIFPAALPPVSSEPGVPFLTDFVLTQPLSKNLIVYAGKKNVLGAADQDEFAGGNGVSQFMNQAFIANPAFLLALPYTSFTAGFVSPQEWGGFAAFVYDPQNRTEDLFKFDDLFSQGVIVGGEVKFKTNFFSLPGEQHIGGIWKHLELTDLQFNEPPPGQYPYTAVPGFPTIGDSYTIYYGFDQYLRMYAEDSKRGWGVFGRASISDGNPTPVQYFLSLGLGGYSPFAYQRGDTFGLGWYYLGASREFGALPQALFGPRDGWGIELFYNFQITPWMNLTPDFQILKPEAGGIADTSYIGGVRLNLKF